MPFKNIFNSSSTSLNDQQSVSSHRSFLKSSKNTNSRSVTPISTASSVASKRDGGDANVNAASGSRISPQPPQGQNNTTVQQQQQQQQHHHHHHGGMHHHKDNSHRNSPFSNHSSKTHSPSSSNSDTSSNNKEGGGPLKRFLKKFKPSGTTHKQSKHAGRPEPIDHAAQLFHSYGLPGKLLGTGASGSVNLLTSKTDPSKIYAVKKFRSRLPNEQESDYTIKVQNEYKVGEYLHHQNIIHTYELIKDYSKVGGKVIDPDYYIVMEYCPYDFFNLVMSGLMKENEINCYFKQIVQGVHFLHENGLAHRDLKLDNCVVNTSGILKLIDFGSAVQFEKEVPNGYYVTEHDTMLDSNHKLIYARGVVGSDPYLSPEVFEPMGLGNGYDPRTADVWSIAIIYCCMILKRFPWKLPKLSDPSYRSFAGPQLNPTANSIENDMNSMHIDQQQTQQQQLQDRHAHHGPQGPEKLFRLLPADSRNLIKGMLILDPKQRYLMSDVAKDPFLQSIRECKVIGDRNDQHTVSSDNHTHHLVTEEDLKKIEQEKERSKKLREAGMG
ncbi:hypothetical protein KGF57_005311 [Candida theae]|uniref:non-specific serine/threonine protein kinase n=1 Tax=Candida theae TaxID=1198502 RepID=A0AAD5FVZ3_9ASCO|nr:uncharacterized protein KGF57_005311 [Candida theae]KAI5948700.1 hypothetical protein KGF57_005311 [Candida theae]